MDNDAAPTEQWTPEQRDDLATLIELQADQPEDVADRVLQWIVDQGFVAKGKHDSLMRRQVEITRLVEAELTKLREDAARWQAFRQNAFIGTDEDGRIAMVMSWDEPDECEWITPAECESFAEGTIERREMPAFADRLINEVIHTARHATGEQK